MTSQRRGGGPNVSDYWRAVEHFCGLCRRDLEGDFVSLIVVGSLSVGDVVPGWSDVDANLVVRSATDAVRGTAATLAAQTADRFPFLASDRGPMFSAFVVTREQVLRGGGEVSFLSQWDVKRHGIVACGEDLRAAIPEPELDRAWLADHLDWMAAYLDRDAGAPAFWKGRNAVCFILAGARAVVLSRGVYAKRKDEIAREFTKAHPDRAATVSRAMRLRAQWLDTLGDGRNLDSMYAEAREFVRWARARIEGRD